jgi:hypothetical protein
MPQSQNKGSGYWSPFEQNKHNFTKEMEFKKNIYGINVPNTWLNVWKVWPNFYQLPMYHELQASHSIIGPLF